MTAKHASPLAALGDCVASKKSIEKLLRAKANEFARRAFVARRSRKSAAKRVNIDLHEFLDSRFFSQFQRSKTVDKIVAAVVGKSYATLLTRTELAWEKEQRKSAYLWVWEAQQHFFEAAWDKAHDKI